MTAQPIIIQADALRLPLPDGSVDAVVCDPPYNLSFMSRRWDAIGGPQRYQRWCRTWARDALRVLRPGGWLLAFGSPRTWHRLACGIEDAGFEMRDTIAEFSPLAWVYGQGFPKSLDVDRAIDMHFCQLPGRHYARTLPPEPKRRPNDHVCPDTPEGSEWAGYGSAFKPSWEPVIVARKPLAGSMAQNVLAYGTGALNIDAARIGRGEADRTEYGVDGDEGDPILDVYGSRERVAYQPHANGRWPSNVALVHSPGCQPTGTRKIRAAYSQPVRGVGGQTYEGRQDGSLNRSTGQGVGYADADGMEEITAWTCQPDCPVALLDQQSGESIAHSGTAFSRNAVYGPHGGAITARYADQGGASRFYPTFQTNDDSSILDTCPPPGDASTKAVNTFAGKRTANSDASSPTDGSGNTPTGQSHPATTSTTGITTRSTTTSPTSNASPPPITSDTTAGTERTTGPSERSSTADASDATPTSPLGSSTSAELAPTKAIAETASGTTTENGEPPTGTTSTATPVSAVGGWPPSSRLFYTAKAGPNERVTIDGEGHPTVKPLSLMRWLVRLVTPPGGLILDMFAGSGTTGEAAMLEGFRSVLIDKDPANLPSIRVRTHPYVRRTRVVTNGQTGPEQGSLL